MNLDELRSVQSKERQKDSLQHLRPSFYREVGEYIGELEDQRERAADAADDPFSSPEVGRLTDEIETARDVVEAIYERRMGKLVKQSSLAAAGMPADDDGLTAEEKDLFDELVTNIESNKARVLDVLDGGEPADTMDTTNEEPTDTTDATNGEPARARAESGDERATDSPTAAEPPPPPPEDTLEGAEPAAGRPSRDGDDASGVSVADAMGAGPTSESTPGADGEAAPRVDPNGGDANEGASEHRDDDRGPPTGDGVDESGTEKTADVERVTVRITREIGSILGVDDREYTLSSDDVVTLPEQNATPLVEHDAAEPLE